ncbi:MAG: FAD-dependent oxidoreductase, partial [Candidatus Heimdallarchaeota archaeon]
MPVKRPIDRTPTQYQKAKIINIKSLSSNVKLFSLKPSVLFKWIPGQFVITKTLINSEERMADYTIISSNSNHSQFDILVENYIGSHVGKYFHLLKIGEEITLKGPHGRFYYEETERDVVFVARDIGISAAIPILRNLTEMNFKHKIFFFNVITENFREILKDYVINFAKGVSLTYVSITSEDVEEDKLTTGKFLKPDLQKYFSNLKEADFYLSGS